MYRNMSVIRTIRNDYELSVTWYVNLSTWSLLNDTTIAHARGTAYLKLSGSTGCARVHEIHRIHWINPIHKSTTSIGSSTSIGSTQWVRSNHSGSFDWTCSPGSSDPWNLSNPSIQSVPSCLSYSFYPWYLSSSSRSSDSYGPDPWNPSNPSRLSDPSDCRSAPFSRRHRPGPSLQLSPEPHCHHHTVLLRPWKIFV